MTQGSASHREELDQLGRRFAEFRSTHPLTNIGVRLGETSPFETEYFSRAEPCENGEFHDQPFPLLKDCKTFLYLL